MDKEKLLWIIFLGGNVYDLIFSFIVWYLFPGYIIEQNHILGFLWNVNLPQWLNYLYSVVGLIMIKILLFVGVYWWTRLFIRVGTKGWIGLLPFVGITLFVDVYDVWVLLSSLGYTFF
ncbi:hypothetical protein [Metallosphaera hakonensis]|uniref:DUF5658 domain-containing protein n=2 Tax=Metallosphaera hakonensis TaxID=79601 RepID=A0A2U9ITR4_9CREN|nr:hypothetical protein [Metallosphaera hakonensis]AWR99372.1 hypothetical protein DFR87_06255 [Metallosphaera hakonensis JCM 8857 = DSM 7519]